MCVSPLTPGGGTDTIDQALSAGADVVGEIITVITSVGDGVQTVRPLVR